MLYNQNIDTQRRKFLKTTILFGAVFLVGKGLFKKVFAWTEPDEVPPMGNVSIETGGVPSGTIGMWSGSIESIPSGWALCNGLNNTPDLRNRFVIGAGDTYSVGNTGGSSLISLTLAEIPSHSHSNSGTDTYPNHSHPTSSTGSAGAHSHNVILGVRRASGSARYGFWSSGSWFGGYTNSTGAHTHSVPSTGSAGSHSHVLADTGFEGSGGSHENKPSYYAICYIMKT